MAALARNLLLQLQVKREALLRRYNERALHRLRVVLRRLRSLLRHIEDESAQDLRDALGTLADTTNAARDWDTLAARASADLRPKHLRRVQPWLDENRSLSHQPVLGMLRSQQWNETLHRLAQYIETGALEPTANGHAQARIASAREAVQSAWDNVESDEDRKHWHKLRIAIKELRYTFDQWPSDALEPAQKKILKHCKRLQETLGTWHDTAVHLQLLREYADSIDAKAQPKLHKALKLWHERMESELRDTLDEARSFLAGKGSDLLQ